MTCNCAQLNKLIDIADVPGSFEKGLTEIMQGDWVKLMRCPDCEQFWRVDEWDKLQTQFAVKLNSKDN